MWENDRVNDPIATRTLRWIDGEEHDVVIRLWAPELVGEGPPGSPGHEMSCKFTIDGLPKPVENSGPGIDSLSALISALTGIRYILLPYRESLSWLDQDGDFGVPLLVHFFDREETRYLEKIVENEIEHFLEVAARPHALSMKKWMKEYGVEPIVRPRQFSDDAIVEMLIDATVKERAFDANEDHTGAHVFGERRRALVTILRTRQDHAAIVARLLEAGSLTKSELMISDD